MKKIWFITQTIFLIFLLIKLALYNDKEIGITLAFFESIVSFPSSLIVIALHRIYINLIGTHTCLDNLICTYDYIQIIVNWLFFTFIGYYQWFIIVPKIFKKKHQNLNPKRHKNHRG